MDGAFATRSGEGGGADKPATDAKPEAKSEAKPAVPATPAGGGAPAG